MIKRESPIVPTQSAVNSALDIFVEGYRKVAVPQMLFGLSVLRSATADQVNAAMTEMQTIQRATVAEITPMLAA